MEEENFVENQNNFLMKIVKKKKKEPSNLFFLDF